MVTSHSIACDSVLPAKARRCPPLVLVVEDDAPFRELVVEALVEMGCSTEALACADGLLSRFQEGGAPTC